LDCLKAIRFQSNSSFAPLSASASRLVHASEVERAPQATELQRVQLSDCIVLTKTSKRDWDMKEGGYSQDELITAYREQGFSEGRIEAILRSHQEQLTTKALMEQEFKDAGIADQRVFLLDELNSDQIEQLVARFACIIALGGDDHAKAVSQFITPDKYLCIINSDVGSSVGALAAFSRERLPELFCGLASGNFLIQEWPRLDVEIHHGSDGSISNPPPSLSEVLITDKESLYTLRASFNPANLGDLSEDTRFLIHSKGSGIIVATGAGSTGWFSSAAKYIYPEGRSFPRTAKRFEYISREPYGDPAPEGELTGAYGPNETMVVRVNSKHNPIVSGDSVWMQEVKEGDEVHIRLDSTPLRVVTNLR